MITCLNVGRVILGYSSSVVAILSDSGDRDGVFFCLQLNTNSRHTNTSFMWILYA